ncbi:MAG: LptF/LptG family permease [Bacteroidota bacterium]
MKLKTIDKYLIKQFIGPFIATFFIALFVLMMQFLWVWVDDLVGKGASFWLLLEVITYNSISLIPWALPIAILISSVMLMGNLGERYELASLKSAGVSLIRIMLPMLYFSIGIGIFSFFCSNNLVPIANLKFRTRLHDIKKQKPTLNLEEGVFNDDFGGFIIQFKDKEDDNKTINDVIINDQQNYTKGRLSMITAETGEMYMSGNDEYFIMNLKNGVHYQEGEKPKSGEDEKYPFTRTKFKEWVKVFDTDEFNIELTPDQRFKNHYVMLSVGQLYNAVDSLDARIESYHTRLDNYVQKSFFPLKQKWQARKKEENRLKREAQKKKQTLEKKNKELQSPPDSKKVDIKQQPSKPITVSQEDKKANAYTPKNKQQPSSNNKFSNLKKNNTKKNNNQLPKKNKAPKAAAVKKKPKAKKNKKNKLEQMIQQKIDKDLKEYDSFYQTFPESEILRANVKDRAKTSARGVLNQSQAIQRSIYPKKETRVKHVFVLYSKFTFALVCCVFLFIGAPMGAIVRKGGFGYPLLIAILFFMVFIVMNILFQKLAESYVIKAEIAVWCPLLILIPIGFTLTQRALEDKKVINLDGTIASAKRILGYLTKRFAKS